uniref:Calcineurin-like phosphoesterase domain-containing protein n=1 Tax=Chromera velia CCMP2878 TaxID=1169474 RepID=A0A0G4HZV6_9ALVE|eukprot:Cvel_34179.t1-p1 / transcript=Cvel_34179.t1 / gene=Cvel_34179 / organism=Chromera_velia_CCMP2878 / gene_product=Probable inactive purple acid phosphatase 28, putative / transcript_product=Probable inactive purple acid phosphatase 28, putative / location=Cvel_scaffold5778:458-2232(-) / protein_length=366 / sequence_SO=supercontig / SO=protein_coding / is_pseudo=false
MRVNGLLLVALFSKFLLGSSKRLRSPRQMMKRSLKVLGKAFGITGKPQQTVTQKPGGCRDLEISVKGDTLRILHMSDFHFHATMGCKEGDVPEALLQEPPWGPGAPVVKSACSRVTEAFLQKLTEDYLPHVDLVVLNGDLIHWNAVKAHETDLTAFLMKKPGFLQYFVDQANVHSVPVVVTLGNHDSPSMSCVNTAGLDAEGKGPSVMDCDVSSGTIKVDQEARRKRWESVQGLFSRSANLCTAEGVHGAGNLVAYANVNGQRLPLVFVDSGTALSRNEQPYRDAQDKEKLYDWVRPSQVGWVKEKLTQGESETGTLSVPGFVFTHHPPALTTRPVTTFWDSFALDEVQILSGQSRKSILHSGLPL